MNSAVQTVSPRGARAAGAGPRWVVSLAVGLACVSACGPSWPTTPDAYVVPAVGELSAAREGPAVDAYGRIFGDSATVYQVGADDPTSGLPPAIIAVVPLGDGTTEADVAGRAVGPGDKVDDRVLEGVKVRSTTSRQGDITLNVRLWHPNDDFMVVVIGTRTPEEADAVLSAVAREARASGGDDA